MAPPESDLLPETRRALRHLLATAQVKGRAPAVVAAVVRGGRPIWTDGWGSVDGGTPDGDTQYRIGSITKTFVTILVLRLRDEGRLDLADLLGEHLPGTPADRATIGSLLAHTAGLAADTPAPWWERTPGDLRPDRADIFIDEPQVFPPGERYHYSNPGYALLGALVERLRGEPWFTALRREVLEPLGMTRTTLLPVAPHARSWAVHPWADVLLPEPAEDAGGMAPTGQLWSTTNDLCRFIGLLLYGDQSVVSASTVAEMRLPASAPEVSTWDNAYGLGLQLRRHDGRFLAGHTGSMPGFIATVWTGPDDDLGAVALANVTSGPPIPALTADLLHAVAEREPRIPEPWRPLSTVDSSVEPVLRAALDAHLGAEKGSESR
jgi:CubicO group peptidase (beta-lactamase class C family)